MTVYDQEVTLAAFISALGYLHPEEHVNLCIVNRKPDDVATEEYMEIELNVSTLARYANYPVHDIVIEDKSIAVMIDYKD